MLLLLFGGGVSLAVFPTIFQATVISTMNESLTKEYGKHGIVTDAWNFVQSQLRCCAVLDNGWIAYRGSWWDHSVNVDIFAMSSKLSGWPTDVYRSITQCQNWQYGPPRFENGAHNDAIYYRSTYRRTVYFYVLLTVICRRCICLTAEKYGQKYEAEKGADLSTLDLIRPGLKQRSLPS
nr:unnamed protein product [Spirometra erinaceieuropaei]